MTQTSDPATMALAVQDLTFHYGRRKALDAVSLAIPAGRTTILLGPNGAGKSTLFSLISGLFAPQAGRIAIAGRDLVRTGAAALAPLGIVFQAQTLDLDLTVQQNLRYFCALRGMARREADARIAEELDQFSMGDRLTDKVRSLNGGHRRRVEIARALLHRPAILLLDEPTVGLDIPTRRDLIARLHERARTDNVALLWATHLIDEVDADDHVIVLHKGAIVAEGQPAALLDKTGADDLGGAFAVLTPEARAA
ncbi:ABC transporter ATP-binding protein [Zhengella mangrovi]|uniref:ABC transporter ATP-binding protein n=1 Tax=Zhengella mangrovi TaxID=1982044 RepID=A0A2G1QMJ3_9HYPH|nr:ABC transporter ATP-binding protein [Zhengella mangrovi]PHP66757.1 ABC transporter ATP-binding protein [Zhengella mangrovi]